MVKITYKQPRPQITIKLKRSSH